MMAVADSASALAIRAVEAEEVELVIEDDGEEEEEEEEGEGEGEGEGDEEVEEASSMSRKEENEKEREREREKAVCVGSGRGVKRPRGCTAKERISKMAPCAGKRSSIYRGVTRHRWTGRYEAHLWDKSTWNENQNKKGKQVYLGAYDEEEAAARAYDLAALKYWGPSGTQINFPVNDYSRDIEEMQNVSREEYLASLRRKSSGFSRGMSKFRCASRHYQPARWDAQMGRIWTGSSPQINNHGNLDEGGATPSLELSNGLRGGSCHTPINIACFLSWLQPGTSSSSYSKTMDIITSTTGETSMHRHNRKRWSGVTEEVQSPAIAMEAEEEEQRRRQGTSNHQAQSSLLSSSPSSWQECCEPYRLPSLGLPTPKKLSSSSSSSSSPSAYSLLFQSQMFKDLLERVSSTPSPPYPPHVQGQFNNAKTQNLSELHTSSSTTTTTSPLQHPHPHPQLKLDPCYFKSETQYAQPSAPPPPPRPPLLPLQRLPAKNTSTPQQQQVLPWNDDNAFGPPLMSWMYTTTKP